MTAQPHDHSAGAAPATTRSARPWWVLPALIAAVVVGSLVVLGILSPSVVLYGGLIGGMLLMHTGGHGGHGVPGGHGGPGGPGGQATHEGHGGGSTEPSDHLSQPSHGSQSGQAASTGGHEGHTSSQPNGSETKDDQHSSHGCCH